MRSKKIFMIIIIVIVVMAAAAWPAYILFIKPHQTDVIPEPSPTAVISPLPSDSEPLSIGEQLQENNQEVIDIELKPLTIAIYGSDARSTETSRSDVIMLIQYNPDDNSIDMVSIPRDSRVEIPDKGMDKINHAYAYGGAELLTQTIENLFETKIDYYFIFGFEDFSEIIDKLGGVDVNAEKDFLYDSGEMLIPKGQQTLNGYQALSYVRFRHDEEGDYGRIRRQQEVIESLYKKLFISDEKLDKALIEIYTENVETNISFDQVLDYDTLLDNRTEITFRKYMLENSGKIIDKIWYGIVDEDSLAEIKNVLADNEGAS